MPKNGYFTMNKETVKKMLSGEIVTETEYNQLLVDYIKHEKNIDVPVEELVMIKQLIHQGLFNMHQVLERCAKITNLQIERLVNLKNNTVIKTFVYEL